ncbi:DUF2442 domain-containing protein [Cylindrospermopsis raciborskii]|uniref:DUF2442 domain-containing protein n=1 Tax=Cylindrospermopsis raciborskii TaxID=77022 RepID=UPI003DA496B2
MNSQIKTPWLKAIKVVPLDGFRLQVIFENRQEMRLSLEKLIQTRERYWRLKSPRYFRQAQIDTLGGICWPEGEDLAPDGLERYLIIDTTNSHIP